MARINHLPTIFAVALLTLACNATAQQPPVASESARTRPAESTLRVQLVLTRLQGEQKVANLPYTFLVSTAGQPVRMRVGVDTRLPFPSASGVQYETVNVGTDIDCLAKDMVDGRFQLTFQLKNTMVIPASGANAANVPPSIRRFETSLNPVLRDGQSTQIVTSTDPITGEVVKIDVTVNVVR
jgi:hypothetical protein